MRIINAIFLLVLALGMSTVGARAQSQPIVAPVLAAPVNDKECSGFGAKAGMQTAPQNLPNIARALKERRKIKIMTIGASSSSSRSSTRDYSQLIQAYLEADFKGLEVEVTDRGVSGELAARAAERMRLEVALHSPDIILWQVGTFDAMAHVEPAQLEKTLARTAKWLRNRNVDLVIVGMHYLRGMTTDNRYQIIRMMIRDVTSREGILRIGRYEAGEMIEKAQSTIAKPADEFRLTEDGYACMSQLVARALATSLFAKIPSKIEPK